jgi:hypothetical protein
VTDMTFAHPKAVVQIIEMLNIADGLEVELQSTFFIARRSSWALLQYSHYMNLFNVLEFIP